MTKERLAELRNLCKKDYTFFNESHITLPEALDEIERLTNQNLSLNSELQKLIITTEAERLQLYEWQKNYKALAKATGND